MRFFGISEHISGMADIGGVLASIDPTHTLDDLTLSAHHWVMGRPKDRAPLLEDGGWRQVIKEGQWDRFHAEWRGRLEDYDAFICFYPPVFARLYRRFDKPIVCQFPIRYEYPYHRDADGWRAFNDELRAGADAGTVLLCANNPYDAAYGELFLERPVHFVPSLCEYTGVRWRPERDDVVYYCTRRIAELEPPAFVHQRQALPRGHTWEDVARCRAIAHFPYNVSTMSIIEQYAMGLPLLFPSIDYAVSLYEKGAPVFAQNSWAATFGDPAGSVLIPPAGFPNGHDPNDSGSIDSLRHWLRFADYYNDESMPGLAYFSSIGELHAMTHEGAAFYEAIHDQMRAGYARRRRRAIDGWTKIIEQLRNRVS